MEANAYLYLLSFCLVLDYGDEWLPVSSARFPAPKGKQIGRLHPAYAFLTDNDTAVESVAGSSPYESTRQLQRLKRRLVKESRPTPVDLPPRTR
jgi:hypothetical protein